MSRNRTMIRVWVVLAGVALAAACGGDSTTAPTPVPLPPDPTPVPASAGDVQATVEITVVNPVASSDREILVKLYNATDGPNWKNDGNWLTDEICVACASFFGLLGGGSRVIKGMLSHLNRKTQKRFSLPGGPLRARTWESQENRRIKPGFI